MVFGINIQEEINKHPTALEWNLEIYIFQQTNQINQAAIIYPYVLILDDTGRSLEFCVLIPLLAG